MASVGLHEGLGGVVIRFGDPDIIFDGVEILVNFFDFV